jgi:hypothetical protein
MSYSKNPIIDRFLQLTVDEGKSVRGLALSHSSNSQKTVVFSLDDGTNCQIVSREDSGALIAWWRDASALMKRMKHVDFNPAVV